MPRLVKDKLETGHVMVRMWDRSAKCEVGKLNFLLFHFIHLHKPRVNHGKPQSGVIPTA